MSLAREVPRRADRQKIDVKIGAGITKATHANKGYAVVLDVATAVGKYEGKLPVVLSGTTAGLPIVGELLDVNDMTKEGSVEVRDMMLRGDAAYDKANNGKVLGTHTVSGVTAAADTLKAGPVLFGGFTEGTDHYYRAVRL